MENISLYTQWLHHNSTPILKWVDANFISWNVLVQITLLIGAVMAAKALAARSAVWLKEKLETRQQKFLVRIHHTSYQEIFFLIFLMLFLWLIILVMQVAILPAAFLLVVVNLITAWGVIRFASSIIESPFWARLISFSLWGVAALNIVGWLDPIIALMDKEAITVGNIRLSLLLIIKSLLAFSILLWAINFLSGVLERSFSKASGLTPSQRVLFYKFSNIALYMVGGIIGLNIVGLNLTTLAVFGGALGLGVGFGLQKIFSNLISGFILLLDKSVKPGDVITIGNTYGWVNSLGARYVSVLTRDGKEHLIPNENLITQEVENWSYTNQKVRIHIPIGVSYGSDVHLVKKLLLQAADEHPRILKNPTPACLILEFGDSSINHDLRVWIEDPEDGVSNIKSAVYYRIWDLFKEHNVEIPFPQRDINVKPDIVEILSQIMQHNAKS